MTIAENKKARFDYEIMDEIEAGIELSGFEVKAIKAGKISIAGSYAIIRGGEVYLLGAEISPYQVGNEPTEWSGDRIKKLFLHKEEIKQLTGKIQERGLTLVPLTVYSKSGKVKVKLALAKHKKTQDKRESLRKKETDIEMRRQLKRSL